MDLDSRPPAMRLTAQLVFGLLVLTAGVLLTLDNLDILEVEPILAFWPAGLIAIGLLKLSQARQGPPHAVGGVLFIAAGTWILLRTLGVIDVSLLAFWPVMLVVAGGFIAWQALQGPRRRHDLGDDAVVSAMAILGGVARGSHSRAFRGGELTAVMGGCEIDLRHAAIHGEAVIDVFAMWGGIEIRVPEDWRVVGRVTPIMGGFDDKTGATPAAAAHTLIIRGVVLMGGVEVKN